MNFRLQIVCLLSLSFFIECNNNSSVKLKAEMPKKIVKKPDIAEDRLALKEDPVCGMPAFKFLVDTTIYKDKIYGFCGEGCKRSFVLSPDKYLNKP